MKLIFATILSLFLLCESAYSFDRFVCPDLGGSEFGKCVVPLQNGNVVITAPLL